MNLPAYIHRTSDPQSTLNESLKQIKPDQFMVLVDENTRRDCLSEFNNFREAQIIEIKSGERHKTLETCQHIWTEMTNASLTRKSLLINLGGGVIGDMGGFCASTYKRGIRFLNIPTTLLAAVDANVGGKLGIDFNGLKNHIGIFNDPERIIIWDGFLQTLPKRELRSGYAEVIKHGLIYDKSYYENQKSAQFPDINWSNAIDRSIAIKHEVVTKDPKELGLRKILNFGHTLGHAIEAHYLNKKESLLHGEAIAVGMVLEAFLSWKSGWISESELKDISGFLIDLYGKVEIPDLTELMPILIQDKKNISSEISFSLLEKIGKCKFDVSIDTQWIEESIQYYENFK